MSLLLCILNGFFWAFFDVTRKLSLKYLSPKILLSIFMIVQVIFFFLWTCFEKNFSFDAKYILPGSILVIISVISAILFLKSIIHSDLSLTIPLLSLTPLFSSFFSFLLLDEKLSTLQYIGIGTVVVGTLILYSKNLKINSLFESFTIIKKNKGALLMILVAFFWSITPIVDKICLQFININSHGLIQSLGMLISLFLISYKEFKITNFTEKSKFLVVATVLIGTVATILQLYSILQNFVPIMEVIKRTIGQTCAVIFGFIIFKEKINKQKVLGVTVLTMGIFFIL